MNKMSNAVNNSAVLQSCISVAQNRVNFNNYVNETVQQFWVLYYVKMFPLFFSFSVHLQRMSFLFLCNMWLNSLGVRTCKLAIMQLVVLLLSLPVQRATTGWQSADKYLMLLLQTSQHPRQIVSDQYMYTVSKHLAVTVSHHTDRTDNAALESR